MKTTLLTLTLVMLTPLVLHADDDDPFIPLNTSVNESFIKVVAKNRASSADDATNFTEINSKEAFLAELKENQNNDKTINTSNLKTEYIYTEIKNVNINKHDLKEIQGDTLNLGTDVKQGKVSKVLKIKNSKIETDKEINMAINLDGNEANSAKSFTEISDSQLLGSSRLRESSLRNNSLSDAEEDLLPLDLPSR